MIVRRYPKDVVATVSSEYENINLRRCLAGAQQYFVSLYGETAGKNFAQVDDFIKCIDSIKDA